MGETGFVEIGMNAEIGGYQSISVFGAAGRETGCGKVPGSIASEPARPGNPPPLEAPGEAPLRIE